MKTLPPRGKEIDQAVLETVLGFDTTASREEFLLHWFRDDEEGLRNMRSLVQASIEATPFFVEAREVRLDIARDVMEEITLHPNGWPEEESENTVSQEEAGSKIGRYRLISRIGEGGGGVVYEAEQQEPIRRQVALKIIRLGMDTERVIARFEIERQALALMDHRNIARVLDAGATESGRPYFVMELVKGERITTYCDSIRLDIEKRMALFIEICDAIQHAHQKGVIHRDIKPSNILVQSHAGTAIPKVIDFGIAKATGVRFDGGTVFRGEDQTGKDQMIGTPAYMSPEQVDLRGIDVDTRSDIYSLGVLLYELLVGRPPFDGEALANEGISQMRRILLEHEPPRPSEAVAAKFSGRLRNAANRRLDADRLVARLRGDLDAIVLKAMEKDRNRRYQTVNSLAMDVRRCLMNEPVMARRPGRLYSMEKFIRRNRGACISGAAVALSLVLGMGASTWLYLKERNAVAKQIKLSKEADASRAEKAILVSQAESRAIISWAGVLIGEGKVEEADSLLQKNEIEFVDPSREAAEVFRTIGYWNARYHRGKQALKSLVLMGQANRYASPLTVLESPDLLATAPIILEEQGREAYERFRTETVLNYLPANTSRGAEHILKSCLLTPADSTFLDALHEVARVCEAGVPSANGQMSVPEWDAMALALYHHRMNEPEETLVWYGKVMGMKDTKDACRAVVHSLAACAMHSLGEPERAARELETARKLIPEKNGPMESWGWWDWNIARIIYADALATLVSQPAEKEGLGKK